MSQKAFLFDMDGVMIDTERTWLTHGKDFSENLWGKEVLKKMGDTNGMNLGKMLEIARANGFQMEPNEFSEVYDAHAKKMYDLAHIVDGLEELVTFLKDNNFKLAIVSAARRKWIEWVLERLPYKESFDLILSLDENKIIHKPNPDGFLEAMKRLEAVPAKSIILEDSNAGITAGKKSGAFTIAYSEILMGGYQQIQADATANSMKEVIEIVKKRLS